MRTFRKCARQLQILTFGHLTILLDKGWEVLLDPDELVRQGREPLEADLGLDLDVGPVDQSAASIEAVDQSETSIHYSPVDPRLVHALQLPAVGVQHPALLLQLARIGRVLALGHASLQ